MANPLPAAYGTTPLPADIADDLADGIHAPTYNDIDERERAGLAEATQHLLGLVVDGGSETLWDEATFREAHRIAFAATWIWGGKYRRRLMNIGVAPEAVAIEINQLFGNARAWREYDSFAPEERCVRFHCEVGRIHPFTNGNGRLARIYADVMLLAELPENEFGWSAQTTPNLEARRRDYIDGMRHADTTGDYGPAVAFALAP